MAFLNERLTAAAEDAPQKVRKVSTEFESPFETAHPLMDGEKDRRPVALASRSPTRRAVLSAAGVSFELVSGEIDESSALAGVVAAGGSLEDAARELAERKALAATPSTRDAAVIGGDQVLSFRGRALQKAQTLADAADRLKAMRGADHFLLSGAAVVIDGSVAWSGVETVRVRLRPCDDAVIDAYVERNGSSLLGSVACYEIEREGAQLIEELDGDYFSALGLPLFKVLAALRDVGAGPP